tara:strand:- start:178 stop:942 length:765 start_codon:yes stop_codon:yes gene_type:complete
MKGSDNQPLLAPDFGGSSNATKIIYTVIARGNVVLTEARHSEKEAAAGNYATVAAKLLRKFPTIDAKNTYNCNDNLNFHLLCSKGVFYLCLADKSVKLRIAYSFLGDVEKDFLSQHGDQWQKANAYSLTSFRKRLQQLMKKWNDPNLDKLSRLQNQVEDVKGVMQNNISKVLERGENLEVLVDRTQVLAQSAEQFHKRAKKVKWNMWCQNMKMWFLLFLVVGIIIGAIAIYVCSGGGCGSSDNGGGSAAPSPSP